MGLLEKGSKKILVHFWIGPIKLHPCGQIWFFIMGMQLHDILSSSVMVSVRWTCDLKVTDSRSRSLLPAVPLLSNNYRP